MSEKVFIYCADPSHSKRVAVVNFERVEGFGDRTDTWTERYTRRNGTGTGQTLRSDNTPPAPGEVMDWDESETYRSRYRLECRKCHRPVVVREPVLFDALDRAAGAGYDSLDLSEIAAIVERSSGA